MSLYPIYIDSSVSGAQLSIGTTNASTIQIGPLTQKTDAPIVSTLINGVRIDSNSTTQNLIVTLSSNPYSVNNYPLTNTNNTMVSNIGFSVNMSGSFCTAVGHNCLTNNTTGIRNDAFGSGAAQTITTGSYNTALGSRALAGSTSSSGNVAVGYEALFTSVVTEYPNVAVGYQALQLLNNSASGANVAVGYKALGGLTTGLGNIAIGHQAENCALGIKTSGYDNVVIGTNSASGNYNRSIVLGADAVATGNDQIILGKAGGAHTTLIQGSGGFNVNGGPTSLKNTIISGTLGVGITPHTNKTFSVTGRVSIGDNSHDNADYGTVNICSDSKDYTQLSLIRAGNTAWQIGTIGASSTFIIKAGSTGVQLTNGGTAFVAYSDRNLKTNIENIIDPIEKINKIKGVYYKFKTDTPEEIRRVGVIAQDVQTVLPEATSQLFEKNEPFLGVKYTELIPLLIEGIKSQQKQIELHQKENDDLKSRLSAIEARLAAGI